MLERATESWRCNFAFAGNMSRAEETKEGISGGNMVLSKWLVIDSG